MPTPEQVWVPPPVNVVETAVWANVPSTVQLPPALTLFAVLKVVPEPTERLVTVTTPPAVLMPLPLVVRLL